MSDIKVFPLDEGHVDNIRLECGYCGESAGTMETVMHRPDCPTTLGNGKEKPMYHVWRRSLTIHVT